MSHIADGMLDVLLIVIPLLLTICAGGACHALCELFKKKRRRA